MRFSLSRLLSLKLVSGYVHPPLASCLQKTCRPDLISYLGRTKTRIVRVLHVFCCAIQRAVDYYPETSLRESNLTGAHFADDLTPFQDVKGFWVYLSSRVPQPRKRRGLFEQG
jgi:hypothetical protein